MLMNLLLVSRDVSRLNVYLQSISIYIQYYIARLKAKTSHYPPNIIFTFKQNTICLLFFRTLNILKEQNFECLYSIT